MVAETGGWLLGRQILISAAFLDPPDWEARRFPVRLSRQQIEDSPPLDSDAPVSRRYERTYYDFFATPYYWLGNGLWGNYPYPGMIAPPQIQQPTPPLTEDDPEGTHLRSVREVRGYHVSAQGEEVGTLDDFIVDDQSWALRFVVIDRSLLPFSKKVLVATEWIEAVDWADRLVKIDIPAGRVEAAPEFDSREPVNEAQETVLYDYYGRPRGRAG